MKEEYKNNEYTWFTTKVGLELEVEEDDSCVDGSDIEEMAKYALDGNIFSDNMS